MADSVPQVSLELFDEVFRSVEAGAVLLKVDDDIFLPRQLDDSAQVLWCLYLYRCKLPCRASSLNGGRHRTDGFNTQEQREEVAETWLAFNEDYISGCYLLNILVHKYPNRTPNGKIP